MKQKKIRKVLESLDFLILAIKAQGGYKYRQQLKLSEVQTKKYLAKSELNLQKTVVSLLIAEEILQEPGYWDRTPRWKEYLKRRDEAMKAVKE